MTFPMEMKYQIGGSLRNNDPTYVVRQADDQLYHALKRGEFCYVLNSRQMGKSSLLQRTSDRLQKEGFACVYLDMTQFAGEAVTPMQWYRGIVTTLYYTLNLTESFNLQSWWAKQQHLSFVQQLHQFIETKVLPSIQAQRLFIFIDEIDSLLHLQFSLNDFFAWIDYCYQQRADNSVFNRLDFAVFGVATPTDLVASGQNTLFESGTAIELHEFQLHEATPLIRQLEPYINRPEAVFQEILYWTQGQPFLTQKLCQLALQAAWSTTEKGVSLVPGTEAFWVEQIVRSHVIQHWELHDDPEHLRTIRDRLLANKQYNISLLELYQQVLLSESFSSFAAVPLDGSSKQEQLFLTGLVTKRCGYLCTKNPIYRSVFDVEWISKQFNCLYALAC
ncbi:AAA-like domain-containing protein [Thermocoleostomius sinensis]|uniref:AAA-like domain-containing protein n=1 Tax=Thermocoleostomius sinensis A174 TaxID=2016057 RepID=A0A9E8ZBY2_9CYAN|nr:AAA-like domain-containing protein [Thermocoleostomius sinensis]WAL60022.1 AAA-like domain-containing protein [Thermocoleostomius sinensis A174]